MPPEIAAALAAGGPAPVALSEKERAAFTSLDTFFKMLIGHTRVIMGTRPQAIGYSLADSPVGLAAWILPLLQNGEPARLLDR